MGQHQSEVVTTIKALIQLVHSDELRSRLFEETEAAKVLEELDLPEEALSELRLLMQRLDRDTRAPADTGSPQVTQTEGESDNTVEQTQLEAFANIRHSFQVAIGMSIVMFLIGAVMLLTAFFRALTEEDLSRGTLAIGGMALADFAILFFRQPWKDVAVNLTNSQRARTLATSYLVGLSLIREGNGDALRALAELTDRSVKLLQEGASGTETAARERPTPSGEAPGGA